MGRYVIGRRLGAGGMAEVFEAEHVGAEGLSRAVALKRILPHYSSDPRFYEQFVREARIVYRFSHPNVVSILDFDRDEHGALFLAMELVDGADLGELAARARAMGAPLSASLAAYAVAEVLRGLAYAHELEENGRPLGIVHRDVSPHNVLVSRGGLVKLADFGIAKATAASMHSGIVRGKLAYMAPEQALGGTVDARADLFAVGVMLYELLTGELPHDGDSEAQILAHAHGRSPVPLGTRNPRAPEDLAAVTMRLLARAPADRYASARQALAAVVRCRDYPIDGATELAARVRALLDAPFPRADAPAVASPPVVRRVRLTRTVTLSPRVLLVLCALAAGSLGVAFAVWRPHAAPAPVGTATAPAAPSPAPATPVPAPAASTPPVAAAPRSALSPAAPTSAPPVAAAPRSAPSPAAPTSPAPARPSRPPGAPAHRAPGATGAAPAPAPAAGSLTVRVAPWARVAVDGRSWGVTPIRRRPLRAGRHRVTLANQDFGRTETVTVVVRPGRDAVVERAWP